MFLLSGLLIFPILLINWIFKLPIRFKYTSYWLSSIPLWILWISFSSFWVDHCYDLRLTHYGYDHDGWTIMERHKEVKPQNLEKVKRLELVKLGIGWPHFCSAPTN